MAVDTREKRTSMLNFGDGTTIHLLPHTDGSLDQGDKQHFLDCYSGIDFSAPAPITAMTAILLSGIAGPQ